MEMIPDEKDLFKETLTSREYMVAKNLAKRIVGGKVNVDALVDDDQIKEVLRSDRTMTEGADISEILQILRDKGVIKPVAVAEKEVEPKPQLEVITGKPSVQYNVIKDDVLDERIVDNKRREEEKAEIEGMFENKEAIEELLLLAKDILNRDVDPEAYILAGLYSKEEVEEHMQYVEKMELIFQEKGTLENEQTKKIATILEAIIVEGINKSQCLGEDVIARPAFQIDDISGPKMDSYILLGDTPLGVDVSMRSIEGPAFADKIKKILRTIKNDKQEGIKYFKDKDGNLQKDIVAPKVIISAEVSMIKELMFYLKKLKGEVLSKKLRSHRMSPEIVSQIVGASQVFAHFAKEEGRKDIAESYSKTLQAIEELAKDSETLRRLLVGAGSDAISTRIRKIVEEFKEEENNKKSEYEEFINKKAA